MGLFTLAWELIWSTFLMTTSFVDAKEIGLITLTFIIVQQTVQLTPQVNGLQVLVQIQSLPEIQSLPRLFKFKVYK